MPSTENRVIIACAGSGKTTRLVDKALANRGHRIAIVTYTNNNVREIRKRFEARNSGQPSHVDVMTWYTFLLRHCVRPYQRFKYAGERIEGLTFVNSQSVRGVSESDTRRFYLAGSGTIYSDKVSKFVVECESESAGAVSRRLARIYTHLFIDEFQDLAGWDFEVIKMLLDAEVCVTLVGDPRQHIYSTNPGRKNKQYLGTGVVNLVDLWRGQGLCTREDMDQTRRCNAAICAFSNALWPDLPRMTPLTRSSAGHEGVFLVARSLVAEYVRRFKPQALRHDKNVNTAGFEALNFGQSKGLEFDRVLIFPTEPIRKYLKTGQLAHVEKAKSKLHVAVTRARFSVTFVCDSDSPVVPQRWVLNDLEAA